MQDVVTLLSRSTRGTATVDSAWVQVPVGTRYIAVQNQVYAAPGGTTPTMTTIVQQTLDQVNTENVESWSTINSQSVTSKKYKVGVVNENGTGFPANAVNMPFVRVEVQFGGTTPTFDQAVVVSFMQ